jgi:hypothetical protein
MITHRAIGVFGGIGFLRRYVEAGQQSDRLVKIAVVDVAAAFFVQELEGQPA